MFRQNFRQSIQYKFLKDISIILFVSTCVLSMVIALNEGRLLRHSLMTKGQSFASYIAKLSQDPFIMKDSLQLDSLVNEANKDEDILYTVIRDAQGNPMTSQYASINFQSPRLKDILAGVSKESEFPDIIAAIKKNTASAELSAPILSGAYTIGDVTICMSEYNIRKQIVQTVLFVVALNLVAAFVLGAMLFFASQKTILNPIVELGHAAARLSKGDLATQVTVKATGELQMLVDSFNQMACDLERTTVSKKTLQTILDSMPYGLVVIDSNRKILSANNAALALMHYGSDKHLIGMSCNKTFCPSKDGGCPIIDLKQQFDSSERTLVTKEGGHVPILKSVVPVVLNGKEVLLEAFVDISDLKRAEEDLIKLAAKLEKSNRELQELTYIASHDLQEPLRKVMAFGGRLQDQFGSTLGDQGKDYLERMHKATLRMQNLIDSLLMYSRITTKALPFAPVNLSSVVQDVLSDLEVKIAQTKGRVEVGDLITLDAEQLQMRQLFQNLVGNALKFHKKEEPPVVKISGAFVSGLRENIGNNALNHRLYRITVEDNGIGFDEKYAERIFGVFQRLHSRNEYEGSGVGLAVCKKIVERHSGHIVARGALEKGAAFIVTLPVKQPEGKEKS